MWDWWGRSTSQIGTAGSAVAPSPRAPPFREVPTSTTASFATSTWKSVGSVASRWKKRPAPCGSGRRCGSFFPRQSPSILAVLAFWIRLRPLIFLYRKRPVSPALRPAGWRGPAPSHPGKPGAASGCTKAGQACSGAPAYLWSVNPTRSQAPSGLAGYVSPTAPGQLLYDRSPLL